MGCFDIDIVVVGEVGIVILVGSCFAWLHGNQADASVYGPPLALVVVHLHDEAALRLGPDMDGLTSSRPRNSKVQYHAASVFVGWGWPRVANRA